MITIYRYTLAAEIQIPAMARFLHADVTPTGVALWFMVDTDFPTETRRFAWVQTGQPLPEAAHAMNHLQTVKWIAAEMTEGETTPKMSLKVTHLFEIPPGVKIGPIQPPPQADKADWWKAG